MSALSDNRFLRCTPCGVVSFFAYRLIGTHTNGIGLSFFQVLDHRFDSSFVFYPDGFGRTADGISDLIAGYIGRLFPFQSDGSGTAGTAGDDRSGKTDGLKSRSGSYAASFIGFHHVGVLGSVDEALFIHIGNGAAFFDRSDLLPGLAGAGLAVDVVTACLIYLAPGDFDSTGGVGYTFQFGFGKGDLVRGRRRHWGGSCFNSSRY